jgi:hypothetical protein
MTTTTPETAPAPVPRTSPDISHAVCLVCFPDCPQPDMVSLCGAPINTEKQYEGDHCVVCEDLMPDHLYAHMSRGEYPR